jgi:hypothetical protein
MSDETKYRVLFQGGNGREQLSDPESLDDAKHTARELERKGYTVGSVMDADSARRYLEYRYAQTYRGVKIPDYVRNDHIPRSVYEAWRAGVDSMQGASEGADGDPFAPDLTMSPEVADFILRAATGLLEDGYWPKAYTGFGPDDADEREHDVALVRRAADIVGRHRIKNRELLEQLAEPDVAEDDPLRGPVCTDPGCPAGYPHHGPCPGEENR